jgi:cellulose synthase/poly-beta-1,6-N-acetylglucosamine synthase-like glycosyltransferase
MKVAVITPYYKESDSTLRRCLDSVASQTYEDVSHYMVADGFPRADILEDYPQVNAISLSKSHSDYGNTPRGVGAMCALNEGADVVCFLDADNLYLPSHINSLVNLYRQASANNAPIDAAFAFRHIFLPDYPELRLEDPEDVQRTHVDTSCYSFSRSAAFMWPLWGMIPKSWSPIGDRVIFDLVKANKLRVAWTGEFSVLYESNWSTHYRQANKELPATGLHDETIGRVSKPSAAELFSRLRIRLQ